MTGPKLTEINHPHKLLPACLPWLCLQNRHPPAPAQPSCKQGPLCLSCDPICLLEAKTRLVTVSLACQPSFQLLASFSHPVPMSLSSRPARLNSYQHLFASITQRWPESRPKLAGSASSYSATHNLLVILLGTSDSDITLLQPGSWWDRRDAQRE